LDDFTNPNLCDKDSQWLAVGPFPSPIKLTATI
jgi:hypothetical protein